jgi:N-glycosylase/DNA lyase
MKQLLNKLNELRQSEVKQTVDKRIKEFEEAGKKHSNEIFKELCYCIMTANFNAVKSMKIQEEIGNGFLTLPEAKLKQKMRELGHRFPNMRADFILAARKHKDTIKDTIQSFKDENELRQWIAENIKGLGYKESSHFLRNIGYKNCAIIDFHIVDLLVKHNLVKRPKTLTKNNYLEIEKTLKELSEKSGLNLAELDLYLWYMETDSILK